MTRDELIEKWEKYRLHLRSEAFSGDHFGDCEYEQRRRSRVLDMAELTAVFLADLREMEDAK